MSDEINIQAMRNRASGSAGMRPVKQSEVLELLDEIERLRNAIKRNYNLAFCEYAPSAMALANNLHDAAFGTDYSSGKVKP